MTHCLLIHFLKDLQKLRKTAKQKSSNYTLEEMREEMYLMPETTLIELKT